MYESNIQKCKQSTDLQLCFGNRGFVLQTFRESRCLLIIRDVGMWVWLLSDRFEIIKLITDRYQVLRVISISLSSHLPKTKTSIWMISLPKTSKSGSKVPPSGISENLKISNINSGTTYSYYCAY